MILITYFGLLLGISFCLLLLTYKKSGNSHRLLGLYLLFLSLATAEPLYQEWLKVNVDPIVPDLIGGLYFLVGPLLLFYSSALSGSQISRWIFHTFVFLCYVLAVVADRVLGQVHFSEIFDFALYEFLFLHVFFYFVWSFKVLNRAKNPFLDKDKMVTKMALSWGKALIVLSLVLFGATFLIVHISLFVKLPFEGGVHPMQIVLLIVILFIGLLNTETSRVKQVLR